MINFTRTYNSVRSNIRDTIFSIKTVFAYFYIVWYDRDWDHSFFYRLMAFKLKRMEDRMTHWRPEVVKDLKMARIICERIAEGKYIDWGWMDERKEQRHFKDVMKREEYLQQQDLRLLGKILEKHSLAWWD